MSELRSRVPSSKTPPSDSPDQSDGSPPLVALEWQPSLSQRALSQTLMGTANLADLLPMGTLVACQLLMPCLSSPATALAIRFTNFKGLWLFDTTVPKTSLPDLTGYRIGFIDDLNSVLSVMVFGAVAMRDKDAVKCLYPGAGHVTQVT